MRKIENIRLMDKNKRTEKQTDLFVVYKFLNDFLRYSRIHNDTSYSDTYRMSAFKQMKENKILFTIFFERYITNWGELPR